MTMSNKSYSIKENPYMKDIQGGEKKVMKKILSVALSTAMAFSMFASVAFGADAEKLTPEQQFNVLKEAGIVSGYPDGMSHLDRTVTRAELAKIIVKSMALEEVTGVASYKDKNYTAKHWAAPYIEAATKAGILKGVSTNPANPLFNPTGNLTVQELAKVLVEANKLEVPTEATNTASDWAKGYVAAAVKAGYIAEGINYQANASRAQTVVAAHAIYEFNNFKVTKAVAKDANNVTLTLSTGEVVEVKLEKALVPGKNDLVYKAKDGRELKYTVDYVVTAATKIDSVTANNLKELTVKFDGDVDAKTAETVGNYSVTGVSNVKFESATLSADKKEVKLLVKADSISLPAQRELTLQVKNVKNSNATKTFDEKIKFTAVDTQLPTVTEVKALGTKAIKVVFSEPVKSVTANNLSNYKIDGKSINASTKFSYPNVLIISADVSVGEHKLSVQGIEDFANFKVSPVEIDFTVVEDTTAPEVVSTKVTDLKKIEIEFNEPVKSVKKAYHSTSSKTPLSIDINDSKVTLNFDEKDRLGLGDTTVYLEGVTDYSNNSADRNTVVKPELDTTRPTLSSVSAENKLADATTITVEFSKSVNSNDIENKTNFVLRNSKGEIVNSKGFDYKGNPVKTPAYGTKDSKKAQDRVEIQSIGRLDAGKYTLEVAGIRDQASVANTMEPAKYEFNVTDSNKVEISSVWTKTDYDNVEFYVQFNRNVQSTGTGKADDINKYSYIVGSGATAKAYPFSHKSASIALYSSDTVRITVNKDDLEAGWASSTIRAVNIADLEDNYLTVFERSLSDVGNSSVVIDGDAKATDRKTIKIKTKTPINSVYTSDFKVVKGVAEVTGFTATVNQNDNKEIILSFDNEKALDYNAGLYSVTVGQPDPQDSTKTIVLSQDSYGRKLATGSISVKDEIKPELATGHTAKDKVVTLRFTEPVKTVLNKQVVEVKSNDVAQEIISMTPVTNTLSGGAQEYTLEIVLDQVIANGSNVVVTVKNNEQAYVITDGANNPINSFSVNVIAAAPTVVAVDFSALNTSITAAESAYNGSALNEGPATGQYTVAKRTALNAAIDAAKLVKNTATSTQAQVDAAKVALDQAITDFVVNP